MKIGLIFFISLFVIVLVPVLIQVQVTRRSMAEFAKRHAMLYEKTLWNLFSTGKIHGEVGHESFSWD